MVPHSLYGAYSDSDGGSQASWEDGERVFRRGWRLDDNGKRAVLIALPDRSTASRRGRNSIGKAIKDHRRPQWPPMSLVFSASTEYGPRSGYFAARAAEPVSLRKSVANKAITMATTKTLPVLEKISSVNGPPCASFCSHNP